MDGKRGAGSPLLCSLLLACLLLLTGVHVKAESTTESSQSTRETSLAPALVSTEPPISKENTNTVTPSGPVETVTTQETKAGTSTEAITSKNGIDSVTATTEVTPDSVTTSNTTNSSDSTQTAVTHSNTIGVSANPNSNISTITSISIVTNSEPSTTNSIRHTSGPTESSTQTITKVIETGSTDHMGNTETTIITTKGDISSAKPVTEETTQSSGAELSPKQTNTVEVTPPSKTDAISEKTKATTEHNVEESPRALSPGSVAAITVIVIVLVLVIFGGAAYWKIRHSSYGRLLEDQDYGSLGNYNNPLYDDS